MRTFAQKPKAIQPNTSAEPKVHAKDPVQLSKKLTATANKTYPMSVPHAVDAVLRAPAQRLDEQAHNFFETRFGYDFSRVRVHTDANAASTADALDARAYTVGQDIVFGRNEYVPESESGRSLLAHELAHVVQQQNTDASAQSRLEIGSPSDRAEQEADTFAHAALPATPRLEESGAPSGISRVPKLSISRRMLRRAPKDTVCKDKKNTTWAGCFYTEKYKPFFKADGKKGSYGADITMHFEPNDKVDAENIAFAQTAQSSLDGQPVSIYFRDKVAQEDPANSDIEPRIRGVASYDYGPKAKDTELSRMIGIYDVNFAAGTKIDALPTGRTPLAGMRDPDKGSELSKSIEQYGRFGHRKKGADSFLEATLADYPRLSVPRQVEAHQIFESAALAVDGAQKGAFYGSVRWGWEKSSSADTPTLIPFKVLGESIPSSDFGEAAKLWNASKTTKDEPSIGLPVVAEMFTTPKKAVLLDSPDKGKMMANLNINTRVEVTDKTDSAHKEWRNVVVVSGPWAGKVGWVKQESLSDRPTETKKPR